MNEIDISNPKISLINCIGTPSNLPSKNSLVIAPVIISSDMTTRLPYGSTMESSHIVKLQIPGLIKQSRHIRISPILKTAPIILLGVLCNYRCTSTLDKQ